MLPNRLDANKKTIAGTRDMSGFGSGGAVLNFGGFFDLPSPLFGLFSLVGLDQASDSYAYVGARLLVLP